MTEIVQIKMEKLVYGGDCLGRHPDGRAVFVPFVLAGEVVNVEIVDDKQRFARAIPVEIVQESPDRITPRCIHFGECGGCQYQNLDYAKQLKAKEEIVRDQFERIGKFDDPPIKPIVPSPTPWNYRNNVQFQIGKGGELGYIHADGEHLLPIYECHLPQTMINDLWPQIELGEDPGLYRLGIRQDTYENLMLILEGEDKTPPAFSLDIPVSAVYTPLEDRLTVLAGDDHLTYEILGRNFQVSARSFFQVNTKMAEKMVHFLLEHFKLDSNTQAVELYAGVGLFSAFIAEKVGQLTAIESSGAACHDFTVNLDDFDNVDLYEAEAEEVLPTLNLHTDVLIADPPRSGLAPAVHDAITALQPAQIAYISCDPATLARDLKKITHNGYRLVSVTPFDLFPQTAHVETIVLMSKVGK
ncbi:MAG: class I SAM-dependent RNA methyltransferase [Brevefilum sp.]|nr:class I SAM-dependent RNA methyltransferase [Brevefilum sp.]MDT8382030.1 class I SAM-dependent RNA methyltransferase [Brevefilum sp.]MDW7754335.1 class I SAM-dependent RNA methyltransferase [Brevefilum sp.]